MLLRYAVARNTEFSETKRNHGAAFKLLIFSLRSTVPCTLYNLEQSNQGLERCIFPLRSGYKIIKVSTYLLKGRKA